MGIPREVARLDQQSNFLYTSSNPLGPGEYQPDASLISKQAPAASFGRLGGNYKSHTAQWEAKMEKYIGVKPGE